MVKTSDKKYLDTLSGLRGLAALVVVITHANFLEYLGSDAYFGSAAVMVFFTLSGFLMSYLYLTKTPTFKSLQLYAVSRFSRVAPMYLLVVVFSFIVFTFIDSTFPIKISPDNLLRHLLFSGSQSILWSIPPEVQYYGFFILVWCAFYHYNKTKRVDAMLVILMIITVFLLLKDNLPGIFFGSKILYFFLGSVVGLIRHKVEIKSEKGTGFSWIQGLVFVFALVIYYVNLKVASNLEQTGVLMNDQYFHLTSNALVTALLIYVLSYDSKVSTFTFANPLLKGLGDSSLSLYLTHMITLYAFSLVFVINGIFSSFIAILVCMVLGHLIYLVIERPLVDSTKLRLTSVLRLKKASSK